MTDLDFYEKTLSNFKFSKNKKPKTIHLKDGRKSIVVWNSSQHRENRGWYIDIFDQHGKRVFKSFDDDMPKDEKYIEDWILEVEIDEIANRKWQKEQREKRSKGQNLIDKFFPYK